MRRITRSYRIRIYPNGAQRRLRDRWFGASRWLWDTALEMVPATCLIQCLRDQDTATTRLTRELRSGQCHRACLERATWH